MTKLIEAFIAQPTDANRVRLINYAFAHPMAICMIDPEVIGQLSAMGVRL